MYYITPFIRIFSSIDKLLHNTNESNTFDNCGTKLSIDSLIEADFVCIIGEPGIGKSRLIEEIKSRIPDKFEYYTAVNFESNLTFSDKEYLIIDALDEVAESAFYNKLKSIKDFKESKPKVKLIFSCRKHYVASYATNFTSIKGITFIELDRLTNDDVEKCLEPCSEIIKKKIAISSSLREILRVPRYLECLLEIKDIQGEVCNIGELFDNFITNSIKIAIERSKPELNNKTFIVLIKRTFEKIALIMEISRRDQISKDELYTILDCVRGNMAQLLLANFDLLFLQSRILKGINDTLQFDNTEFQEYLAAKELARHENIESILYDMAVDKELKHIHPNWYDVIPHISYSENGISKFINIIKLVISYESNIDNQSFENLLRYIDPVILSYEQKTELFNIVVTSYLRSHPLAYMGSQIITIMEGCYTSSCCDVIMPPDFITLNTTQLANYRSILEKLRDAGKLDKAVFDYWSNAIRTLITNDDDEYKIAALYIGLAIEDKQLLISWLRIFNGFSGRVKDAYYEVTGYSRITETEVVDCWLSDAFIGNPCAINAITFISDVPAMIYSYGKIISHNKIHEFFNPTGVRCVFYEYAFIKQFGLAWKQGLECQTIFSKIIAHYLLEHSYSTNSELYPIVRTILLNKDTGKTFIDSFDRDWYLYDLFGRFNAELIDAELLSALEYLLNNSQIEQWQTDDILATLTYKIRNDEGKRDSISAYLERYGSTMERWDKDAEKHKSDSRMPELSNAYKSLINPNLDNSDKYAAVHRLSQNLDFVQNLDLQPIIDTIKGFFNNINLDEVSVTRKNNGSFTISWSLIYIPCFVRLLHQLGKDNLLVNHRDILLKVLPVVCLTSNIDANEIRDTYKTVIGTISTDEQRELVEWWKSRDDDFADISPDDMMNCITGYGIQLLSYKLEEYVDAFVRNPDLDHSLTAEKALKLISEGYCDWDINRYRHLFNSLSDDNIDGIKMLCNGIIIEKFQDADAIIWRINYLKEHIYKSVQNQTSHVRSMSREEVEVTRNNPQMFRCFMSIKGNENFNKQMLELLEMGLSLSTDNATQEYSSYLLNQIYRYFITNGTYDDIHRLRIKIEMHQSVHPSYFVNRIMNNAEMVFLNLNKTSIEYAIKQYNRCVEECYLNIRNDGDLRRYFSNIYIEVQKEIQDQGAYSLIRSDDLNEDFIQRELKNTIVNKCCQMGLENVRIDREVALQDNKRTDILIRYGFCNPIMIELKLLNNEEIQNDDKRREYKRKFIQYMKATDACLSVFWVFNVHRKANNDESKFEKLKTEYLDISNTLVILSDCKCSSGIETGLLKKKSESKVQKGLRKRKKK